MSKEYKGFMGKDEESEEVMPIYEDEERSPENPEI